MKKLILVIPIVLLPLVSLFGQSSQEKGTAIDSLKTFTGGEQYPVEMFDHDFKSEVPKNIILMIGDGMGVSQVFSGWAGNGGKLFLENFKHLGFSLTQAESRFITDSAAGATALSTGQSTYNGAIGMVINAEGDTVAARTVVEIAEEKGLSTGIVASSALSHATPASFVAHQRTRQMYDAIGYDYIDSGLEVMIGAGHKNFADRADGLDLISVLQNRGYQVLRTMDEIETADSDRIAGITAYAQPLPYLERDLDLPLSTRTALRVLNRNPDGFFLMVEGSQIDWGSHNNNTTHVVREMMDFDRAIGQALEFAHADGETLIVVTADHETGGMAISGGDIEKGTVSAEYTTGGHTAVMVPVFAYGPGAENFTGILKNTEIGKRIIELVQNQ